MVLYPNELERIAKAVTLTQDFFEELNALYNSNDDVSFEAPECITIKVFDVNGNEMGVIDWTEHGNIGFISNDHKAS